ncbi:hypothetical protein HZA57_05540, partial [Candidatus Poribacteria bacterium]|nr:hypothetical protein [Candidatus Poribacteria bacterium]
EDGSKTRLIDLHRKSTPITPRVDASLFNFEKTLNRQGATMEKFLEEISVVASVEFDPAFDSMESHMEAVVRGLASMPGEYPPPLQRLKAAYSRESVKRFNAYSFLARARKVSAAE